MYYPNADLSYGLQTQCLIAYLTALSDTSNLKLVLSGLLIFTLLNTVPTLFLIMNKWHQNLLISIQQMFAEYEPCAVCWRYSTKQTETRSQSPMSLGSR